MTPELTAADRDAVYGFDPRVEAGFVGTRRRGGLVFEELLPELSGDRGRMVWREMGENDPVVGAMLLTLRLQARQVDWQVRPSDPTDEEARRIAAWAETVWWDMNVTAPQTIAAMMSFLQYGWFVGELLLKRRLGPDPGTDDTGRPLPVSNYSDGLWGVRAIEPRLQDTLVDWVYDRDDAVALRQVDPVTGRVAVVPLAKAVHLTTTSERANPEGRSILRSAYRPWMMKKRLEEIEAVGVERDLVGLPMALIPASLLRENASAGDRAMVAKVRETVTKVRRNETDGLVFPVAYDDGGRPLYDFKLVASGGNRQFDIGAIITRYDQRILLTGLTDFLLLGHEGVSGLGTAALGITKVDLVNSALDAYLGLIAAEMNAKLWPTLMRLNGMPLEKAPELVPGQVKAVDLATLVDYVAKLANAGMPLFPNPELEQHLANLADLPYDAEAAVLAGPSTEAQ